MLGSKILQIFLDKDSSIYNPSRSILVVKLFHVINEKVDEREVMSKRLSVLWFTR